MKQNNIFCRLACIALLASLLACGGGSDDDSTDRETDDDTSSNTQKLGITGSDTAELGSELEVEFYAYRSDFNGATDFLAATSSGVILDVVRTGFGELNVDSIDATLYQTEVDNSVVFNIFELGISMRVNIDGESWLYSISCTGNGCENITFDRNARTVTMDNVELMPTIGGDANSQASAVLTVNGTLSWLEGDEDTNAPANT